MSDSDYKEVVSITELKYIAPYAIGQTIGQTVSWNFYSF